MLTHLANFTDKPMVRVILSLAGLAVSVMFGLFAIVLAATPITRGSFLIIIGGLAGLRGWWVRVLVRGPILASRPLLRRAACAALAAGVVTALSAIPAFPGLGWCLIQITIAFAGMFLFLGTLVPGRRTLHS